MAESFAISRSHLMYGVCLPLAVLVGYFLATPFESDSLSVVILVLSVLSVPLLMRWHYPLLIFSWNAPIFFSLLPGRLSLGVVMVGISLTFSLMDRTVGRKVDFFGSHSVSRSLVFLTAVIVITAVLTGGVGVRALGSASFGGRKYLLLFMGVLGYFAMVGQRMPRHRVGMYVALFYLSGLLIFPGLLGDLGGPSMDFLHAILPESFETEGDGASEAVTRFGSINFATMGLFCFLLMRYGLRGVLDIHHPWRATLLLLAILGSLFAGFRSVLVMYALILGALFYWEGLLRTRLVAIIVLAGILGLAITMPFVRHFPLSVQRTLSFLPVEVDPIAQASADASTEWRLDMWRELLPEVPKYLFLGKGYAVDPNDMFMVWQSELRGFGKAAEFARLNGDYHSGPFSLIIPFGIFGVFGFAWFSVASLQVLYKNYRYGDPALLRVNTFLLAIFIARLIFFLTVFGSFSSDLINFAGLVGFGVTLNRDELGRGGPEKDAPRVLPG